METFLFILGIISVPIIFVTIFFASQLYDRYRPVLMVTVTTTQTWNRKKTKHLLSYDIRYRIQDGKRKARVHSRVLCVSRSMLIRVPQPSTITLFTTI